MSGAWRFAMAICTTSPEWGSESAYFSRPFVQIVQAIFWRALSFLSPFPAKDNRADKNGHVFESGGCAVFKKAFAGLRLASGQRAPDGGGSGGGGVGFSFLCAIPNP